jgi:hypothetical protein
MSVYKNKAVLFGGVFDSEGPRHNLVVGADTPIYPYMPLFYTPY